MTEAIEKIEPAPAEPPAGNEPPPAPAGEPAPIENNEGTGKIEGGDDKPSVPDNWRELLSGGNEDVAKLVIRYGTPANVGKALLEKERIIRQGLPKVEKPSDPNDTKAWAEYRKAEGIPDDPTGYVIPEDVKKRMFDEDKPVLASFTEFVHQKGGRPDVVSIASEWYVNHMDAVQEQLANADKAAEEKCEDTLRSEWAGVEYKGNINLATRFIEDQFGMPFKEFSSARLPDGRRLGNIPEFIAKLSEQGRNTYGDAAFANSDVQSKHENRMKEIEKIRDTNFELYEKEYAKEYLGLLETDLKRKK